PRIFFFTAPLDFTTTGRYFYHEGRHCFRIRSANCLRAAWVCGSLRTDDLLLPDLLGPESRSRGRKILPVRKVAMFFRTFRSECLCKAQDHGWTVRISPSYRRALSLLSVSRRSRLGPANTVPRLALFASRGANIMDRLLWGPNFCCRGDSRVPGRNRPASCDLCQRSTYIGRY